MCHLSPHPWWPGRLTLLDDHLTFFPPDKPSPCLTCDLWPWWPPRPRYPPCDFWHLFLWFSIWRWHRDLWPWWRPRDIWPHLMFNFSSLSIFWFSTLNSLSLFIQETLIISYIKKYTNTRHIHINRTFIHTYKHIYQSIRTYTCAYIHRYTHTIRYKKKHTHASIERQTKAGR